MSNFKVIELVKCPHCNGKGYVPLSPTFFERLMGVKNTVSCSFCTFDLFTAEYVVTRFVDLAEAIKQSEKG